jgi:hypothetical protein
VTGIPQSTSFTGTFSTSTARYNTPGVKGAPYSAEQVQERVQTLADGTHITQNFSSQLMWRDSQGRTRTERSMGSPMNSNAPKYPVIVEILDPVVGCEYILDTQAKVAHRIALQPMPTPTSVARISGMQLPMVGPAPATATSSSSVSCTIVTVQRTAGAEPMRLQSTRESLGTQMIEGVPAQGNRTTTVYPVGSQGNDRPISVISESWYSPDLRTTILSKTSDPRTGDNTMKWTNISRNEPDPLLFMPPADYSVVEEAGPQVTIHYTVQR